MHASLPRSRFDSPRWPFLAGLLLYGGTLCFGLPLGPHAGLFTPMAGLDGPSGTAAPLYRLVLSALSTGHPGGLALRMNAFNALCAAGVLALLFIWVRSVPRDRTREEMERSYPRDVVQRFAAWAAVLLLAFAPPFWLAATRAHPVMLHLLLVMGVLALLPRLKRSRGPALPMGVLFLCGVFSNEYAPFLVLSPLIGLWMVGVLWLDKRLRPSVVVGMALAFVAGLAFCLAVAWQFSRTPAHEWREFTGFWQTIRIHWRDQLSTLRRLLPNVGWLMMGLTTAVPWLLVHVPKRSGAEREARFGSILMHVLLAALALALVFGARISPWGLFKASPLFVASYVFIAMWAAYVFAYLYALLRSPEKRTRPAVQLVMLRAARYFRQAVLAVLLVPAALNFPLVSSAGASRFDGLLRLAVRSLGERTWLYGDGAMDSALRLAARLEGRELRVINPQLGGQRSYRNYLADQYDQPRYRTLARVGLGPLLRQWFADEPELARRLAAWAAPNLWLLNGQTFVPEPFVYGGRDAGAPAELAPLLEAHRKVWRETQWLRDARIHPDHPQAAARAYLLRHLGKAANNLGYALEDGGLDEEAWEAYAMARAFDADNLSALVNQLLLASRRNRPERDDLKQALDRYLETHPERGTIWALSSQFGFVRHPEALVEQGMAWAASGRPAVALRELQQAAELGGQPPALELALAHLHAEQGALDEGERRFRAMLERQPDSAPALMGLVRIALSRSDFDQALELMRQAEAAGVPPASLAFERALVTALQGQAAAAREALQRMVRDQPDHLRAWTLLALLASEAGDREALDRALAVLNRRENQNPFVLETLVRLRLQQQNYKEAYEALSRLAALQPGNTRALEQLLQLDRYFGYRDRANDHVRMLLEADPGNAMAHRMLASLHVGSRLYALAAESFQASLERERSIEALTNLAWVLQHLRRPSEGLPFAEEAAALQPDNPGVLHTLGLVYLRLGRAEDAQRVLVRSLELNPDSVYAQLYLALVYEARGLNDQARELCDAVLAQRAQLIPEAAEEAEDLRLRLRRRG